MKLTPSPGSRAWGAFKELADLLAKIAIPLLAVVVGLVGWKVQQGLTTSQLLNQREQSDTTIRAEMFKALSDKVFRTAEGKLPPEQRAVFAELLALNFHQHIEVKPLMIDVERELFEAGKPKEIQELRAVARRVRARQVQWLTRSVARNASSAPVDGIPHAAAPESVSYIAVQEQGEEPINNVPSVRSPCEISPDEGVNVRRATPVFFVSPSGKDLLAISANDLDFSRDVFRLAIRIMPATQKVIEPEVPTANGGNVEPSLESRALEFSITWYDFPMTDNTLLKSGLRYAVFLDQVCPVQRVVRLGVLWFPTDFYPAFERPISTKDIMDRLNLGEHL